MNCKTVLLKDLVLGEKGSYGIGAPAVDYDPKKYTYLRITDINDDGSINTNGLKSVDAEDAYKYILQENDIVFARTGASTGKTYFYQPQDGTLVYAGFLIKFSIDPQKVNPRLLKYITHSQEYYNWVRSFDTGGTRGNINAVTFANMPITLPDRATQDKIVAILSSLDDKIELNRRINANLEQQAQALYKSWFVDFEPFGGKMPEDWRGGTLGEIAEFRRGKGILGKDTIKGNIPVVAGGLEPAYYHNLANTKAPVVTISASGANAGFMRMYNVDVWASDCSYIDSRCANLLWTYCYLKINAQLLKHAQTGAVQPHVKASDVNAFEIIIPSSENILNFQQKVKPIFDQIANNERENIHLAQLRDTLLPKLMSGEITI